MRIAFSGFFADTSGYGEAARRYFAALKTQDVELFAGIILSDGGTVLRPDPVMGHFLSSEGSGPADVHLIQAFASSFDQIRPKFMSAPRVGSFFWETDRLHQSTLEGCRKVDRLIAPSVHNAGVLARAGFKAAVVPLPTVIPTYADELPAKGLESIPDDRFVFYSVFTWQERKNPIGLLAAYFTAFTKDDNVELVLKVHGQDPKVATKTAESIVQNLIKIMALRDAPHVSILGGTWNDQHLWGLHGRGDVYVSLTRAEAFGIPLMDAAAVGNRIIVPGYGGHVDFLPKENTRWVNYRMMPVIQMFQHFDGRMQWADPDTLHAAALMRKEYELGRQPKAVPNMAEFSPLRVGQLLVEALAV